MPKNRFNGSEAPDYPKGNGTRVCIYIDHSCIDMLKVLASIKQMTGSQVIRELIRHEQRNHGVFINGYHKDDKTPGLFG